MQNLNRREPSARAYVGLGIVARQGGRDCNRIPKDVIVTTPEEFAWRKAILGTIERPAAFEGKVLYART